MSQKKPFVPVVAVLNMKGGVGKTTMSAHVFRVLYQSKRVSTLLIDLDPQFNLTQALFKRSAYDDIKSQGRTISAVMEPPSNVGLFTVKKSSIPPADVDSLKHDFYHLSKNDPKPLSIIAGDIALVKYSLMDDNKQLLAVRERFLNFINASKDKFELICIDCNPSSSFITLCALHACTHVLVPVRPDKYSVLGLEMLTEFVAGVPSINPKPQFIVALNGIPRSGGGEDVASIEAELRAHPDFGKKVLARVIHETSLLKAKTDYTGFATDRRAPWSSLLRQEVTAFANELGNRLGV
ncbi:ParA family protein [Methylobacterium fujisawaense]|uniref:ParA family protein n=1 Tax=Methylobacterium fujisawaense TaxID=107400 RepID=UPI003CE73CAF